jgi:hypothetical protein
MARLLKIRRGDIWWADLDPTQGREQAGRRPVLILSQDVFNDRSGTVIAVAITSQEPTAGFRSRWNYQRPACPNARGSRSARYAHCPCSDWTPKSAKRRRNSCRPSSKACTRSSVTERTRWGLFMSALQDAEQSTRRHDPRGKGATVALGRARPGRGVPRRREHAPAFAAASRASFAPAFPVWVLEQRGGREFPRRSAAQLPHATRRGPGQRLGLRARKPRRDRAADSGKRGSVGKAAWRGCTPTRTSRFRSFWNCAGSDTMF